MRIYNNFRINNPILHYKLDPGEPGMATPTHASQSITKVATHEGTNIRRFRREAIEKGGVVVYSNIHLNLEYKGSFLAATSGKSEALIIIPGKEKNNQNIVINNDQENKNKYLLNNEKTKDELDVYKNNEDEKDHENSISLGINDVDEIEEINDVIERLEDEKLSLEGQLSNDKVISYRINDNEVEDIYKENRLNEVEKKIQYLEQKKELEMQKRFLSNIMNSKNMSFKLVGLIYNNLNQDINGTLLDTII